MKSTWVVAAAVALISSPVFAGAGEHGHGQAGKTEMGAGHGHDTAPANAAKPERVTRSINVTMYDTMRFDPPRIRVLAGETIRFRLTNAGGVPHEMVIGSSAALSAHAQAMRGEAEAAQAGRHAGQHHAHHADAGHDDSVGLLLAPGQRGALVKTFRDAGSVEFACLVPGHREAGMTGIITVD